MTSFLPQTMLRLKSIAYATGILLVLSLVFGSANSEAQTLSTVQIGTYHGDGLRTGWTSRETVLTPAAVRGTTFKQLGNVALDAQVDAQPLFVGSQTINGQGVHNVVYIATENNTVYAIDADSGAILLQKNFGAPLPISALPGACSDNGAIVGITAT